MEQYINSRVLPHLHVPLRVQSVPVGGGVNVLVDTAMQSYIHTGKLPACTEKNSGMPGACFTPRASMMTKWDERELCPHLGGYRPMLLMPARLGGLIQGLADSRAGGVVGLDVA